VFAVNRGSLIALGLLSASCRVTVSEAECKDLLDRYTDKLIDQAHPSLKPSERHELLMKARAKAATDPEFSACPSRVTRNQLECSLAAPDVDSIERCLL
jgi:hypothetical protein